MPLGRYLEVKPGEPHPCEGCIRDHMWCREDQEWPCDNYMACAVRVEVGQCEMCGAYMTAQCVERQ